MMFRPDVKIKIEQELARGEDARKEGFEGRARVCARRGAGAAVREYLEIKGLPVPGLSAVELLAALHDLAGTPPQVKQSTEHLLQRVDESFSLPAEVDLLVEARWLVDALEAMV